jgi:hypothetical protein
LKTDVNVLDLKQKTFFQTYFSLVFEATDEKSRVRIQIRIRIKMSRIGTLFFYWFIFYTFKKHIHVWKFSFNIKIPVSTCVDTTWLGNKISFVLKYLLKNARAAPSLFSRHPVYPPLGFILYLLCARSGFCNFMHLKPISRKLRSDLYGRSAAKERAETSDASFMKFAFLMYSFNRESSSV